MAENKKLEEIVDLLADYGGFDRDYLKDKLLNSSKEKPDNKNKNKMPEVARLFGKQLGEEFKIKRFRYSLDGNRLAFVNDARFSENGLEIYDTRVSQWRVFSEETREILTGEAVIVDD